MKKLAEALAGLGVIGIIILVLVLMFAMPLIFIWSANSLFGLQIAYTPWTWFVALVFLGCVRGGT